MSYEIFVLDPTGRITSGNGSASRIDRGEASAFLGKHFSVFFTDEDRRAGIPAQALELALRDGSYETDTSPARADEHRRVVSIRLERLHDEAGRHAGFVQIVRESGFPYLHSAADGRAGQSQTPEALSEASGSIVHDLNNTFQVIKNGIELLRRSVPQTDSEPARRLFDMLKRNTDHAAGLLRQLLKRPPPQQQAVETNQSVSGDAVAVASNAGGAAPSLSGLRVFVIEDESLIGMLVEDLLDQLGCEMVGLATSVQQALELVPDLAMDCALLDINLQGESGYRVADALQARGVPLVFMSGQTVIAEPWSNRPLVRKPFELEQLKRQIERAVRGR